MAQQPTQNFLQRRIAIMGYPCVGKSSITMRLVSGSFPDAYDTTIADFYEKNYKFNRRDYKLKITDTAGQTKYMTFPRLVRFIDAYVLVYAIDDRTTFEALLHIYDLIREHDMHVPLLLIGNKTDLEQFREVSYSEGKMLADKWGAEFLETSAKKCPDQTKILNMLLYEIEIFKGNLPAKKWKKNKCCVN